MSEQTEIVEITLRLPGREEKGFLKRLREVRQLTEQSNGAFESWEALAGYLVEHDMVQAPTGMEPSEAVAELSQADLNRAARVLMGNFESETKTINPPTGAA